MCPSYFVVPCLEQNTVVNVSELLCGTESRPEYWCYVSELLCGTMSRPEYWC